MNTNNTVQLTILNKRSVKEVFRALALVKKTDKAAIRRLVKAPIKSMYDKSKINLSKQKSIKTGSLIRSLSTSSHVRKDQYIAEFNSSSKYNYAIDKGTGHRFTNSGRWTGAVGRATTNYSGRNYSFKLGFATRAIDKVLPTIEKDLTNGLDIIIQKIINREMLS